MAAHGIYMAAQRLLLSALGLLLAAQRLHIGAHGAPHGGSGAAFGCRGVAFCCTGAVHGSHAADMQYMLHLAGPGWAARIQGRSPGDGKWTLWGPSSYIQDGDQPSRIKAEGCS